ncbi:hypothetical protein ACFFMM_04110 [Micromonospora chaiyaphumensis]|uniref:Uncharacterized protein n=1 Tax=Micromonospora chaiyaphumensis TaxID=307119 RepID=A0A1C4ZAZ6_9ACTN|nr:hypothetical protein [Micromonospora chaiyaphumensis]SCF30182.1 hypothetical protein GA0070214_11327 [Micromonospora chaiyaphumensis]
MAVVVLPEVRQELRVSQSLLLEVRSGDGRLPAAMVAVRDVLLRLEAPGADGGAERVAFLPPPVPLPGRHLLAVDFGSLPDDQVLAVPDLLLAELRRAGVGDAEVGVAHPGDLDNRPGLTPAVRAYLRGPVAAPFGDVPAGPPVALLDLAAGWVARHSVGRLSLVVFGVETALPAETAPGVARSALATAGQTTTVSLVADGAPVAAATVGTAMRDAAPAAALTLAPATPESMRELRELLRAHADTVIWAGVAAEPDARRLLDHGWAARAEPGQAQPPDVAMLADLLVPEPMWYQVLSAGHLERLGGPPPGALPLPGGRVELTVGGPEQWLPGHPDATAVRRRARDLLAACLVDQGQAAGMMAARLRR